MRLCLFVVSVSLTTAAAAVVNADTHRFVPEKFYNKERTAAALIAASCCYQQPMGEFMACEERRSGGQEIKKSRVTS